MKRIFFPSLWSRRARLIVNGVVILGAVVWALVVIITERENFALAITMLLLAAAATVMAKLLDVFAADSDASAGMKARLKYGSAFLGLLAAIFAVPAVLAAAQTLFDQAVIDMATASLSN